MYRASSGDIRDPPTWTSLSDVGSTGSHSQACVHSFASAFTSAVTVTRWRSISANADSGLGSSVNTTVAPTLIDPSRPGQANGKLWPAGSTAR